VGGTSSKAPPHKKIYLEKFKLWKNPRFFWTGMNHFHSVIALYLELPQNQDWGPTKNFQGPPAPRGPGQFPPPAPPLGGPAGNSANVITKKTQGCWRWWGGGGAEGGITRKTNLNAFHIIHGRSNMQWRIIPIGHCIHVATIDKQQL
jgi:hypothetical protein